ncbi:MAG: AMP-binding protein, partial [Syntrophales bacterium]|nr:AMP-binding protein [Syntrophales bacterium]
PGTLREIETAIHVHRPSVISLVPAQLIRLLASEGSVKILQGAKAILLGGAPSPAWLIEKALDLGIPIVPSYGATESCAQIMGVRKGANRMAYLTAGSVLPYREIRIAGDGAILLGGKTIFKRYLHERRSWRAKGEPFFRTADAGYLDASGNLVVLGRTDGMFISGGENIHPFEIENHLMAMDRIVTAIVVPARHREFGMVPWAFVETPESIDEQEVIDALKMRLPSYKVPKRIIRLDPGMKREETKFSRKNLAELARQMAEGEGKDR